jgi:TetR/AcrR family transcriptional regulator, regulator of mycofactocin system
MAVVESAENPGAWEQRRVQVALRIELAGLQLIGESGFDDVTVEQIATEAGISVRTFFRYFRNVRDILTAVPEREARRMCRALLVRPPGESLLDGFHGWFHEMEVSRDVSTTTGVLEREAFERWSVIVRDAPDVIASESRALTTLTAEVGEVVRVRLGFGSDDDEKVGVLSAAFAAVIWYVFTRSLAAGDPDLPSRLNEAFDLLGHLHATERT